LHHVIGGIALLLCATCSAGETSPGERAYARGDYFSAATAFRDAAAKGDVSAQKRLGDMYADGVGVPQSYTEAIKCYCKAAEQGHAPAVARLYALGFAGRPGAFETADLDAACQRVLHPAARAKAVPRTDQEHRSDDVRVTIERYTTMDDYSDYRLRNYHAFPYGWRHHRLRPPVHRPGFHRPPFAIPTPGP
jgi:TPR repeat protein